MGLGVGIVASMAEDHNDKDLVAIAAKGLFPRSTTWIGYRKGAVLRRYMIDFIGLFAPHIDRAQLDLVQKARTQGEIDAMFSDADLPLRAGALAAD